MVSVIIPVYNVERYLERCLESFLAQSYGDFELLLVDDGSTDSSGAICEKYARHDSRVFVCHKENGGLSDARNYGIERANGEYITFVDSDDFVHRNYLSCLVEDLEDTEADISTLSLLPLRENADITLSCMESKTSRECHKYTSAEALEELLYDRVSISVCGKLFRKELFDGVRFPYGRHYEDVGTTGYLFDVAKAVTVRPTQYYFYCMRGDSISHQAMTENSFDRFDLAKQFGDYLTKNTSAPIDAILRFEVCHALSVLRLDCRGSQGLNGQIDELEEFVKNNASSVLLDSNSSLRDKLGVLFCLFGRRFYLFAWSMYSRLTGRDKAGYGI